MKKTAEGVDLFKDTALDDEADIYRKRQKKTEKQKWSELDGKQKREYFFDYYFVRLAAGAAIAFAVIFLLVRALGPKPQSVLYAAVMDESLDKVKTETMTAELEELLGADGKKQQVTIDDSFYTQGQGLEKLQVYLFNSQIDVLIAERSTFEELAGYGYFQDMETVLGSRAADYAADFVYAAGYAEEEEQQDEPQSSAAGGSAEAVPESGEDSLEALFADEESGHGASLPYGIALPADSRFSEIKQHLQEPVFAVVGQAPNAENAVWFLDYLME